MFAPYPVNSTTRYALPGTLRDGRPIELLPFLFSGDPRRLTPANEGRLQDMDAAFAGDERWRKYFENLHDSGNARRSSSRCSGSIAVLPTNRRRDRSGIPK